MPRRHQLRRDTPLPAGVVRVDRATMWGNPFRADKVMPVVYEIGYQEIGVGGVGQGEDRIVAVPWG